MAVPDEDWKKFMNSIDEDPEDVETDPDEEAEDEDPDDPDEKDPKNKKPTKSKEDEEEDPDDPEEDEDPDEDEDEDDPEEDPDKKGKGDYKPRLKQFINKDGSYNTKGVEDAYVESGKQAVKLNGQLKEVQGNYGELLGAIKANPEVAEKLFGKQGAKQLLENDNIPTKSGNGGGNDGGKNGQPDLSGHPLIRHISAQLNAQSKKEYNDFVDAHPEAVTDPTKAEKIGEFLKYYGPYYSATHDGEIAPMKVALEAAFREFGWDLKTDKKESIATAAKKTAATRRSSGAKRSATKKEVSQGEQFFAKKLGVKLKS